MWLALLGVSFGGDCPWTEDLQGVRSGMTWVEINGETHDVVGGPAWRSLKSAFESCGMDRAATDLQRWRARRRLTNWSTLGIAAYGVGLIFVPIYSSAAGTWRRQMEVDLNAWTPDLIPPPPAPDLACSVGHGKTRIEFVTGEQAAATEARRAEAEMRPAEPTPALGVVAVRVERSDIRLANPAGQVVIFEHDGLQISRFQPGPAVPHTPGTVDFYMDEQAGQLWWESFEAEIPAAASFPLLVHVADKEQAVRCTWTLAASGEVSRWAPSHVEIPATAADLEPPQR